MTNRETNEDIEISLLLEAIYLRYGYDFRTYAMGSIKRRIHKTVMRFGLPNISQAQHLVLNDEKFFDSLLSDLSINVTEMFRDPRFFRKLREDILPRFGDHELIKIWHAGCASGEEVYSMAIMLHELGILDRTQLYATDFNAVILQRAKDGIFPSEQIKVFTENYHAAGGEQSFGDYYTASYDNAIIPPFLRNNIIFADHNLTCDQGFGEMDIILCRNVLIYFSRQLQDNVTRMFTQSLCDGGYLCLGNRETLQFSDCFSKYKIVDANNRIYLKHHSNQPPCGAAENSTTQCMQTGSLLSQGEFNA